MDPGPPPMELKALPWHQRVRPAAKKRAALEESSGLTSFASMEGIESSGFGDESSVKSGVVGSVSRVPCSCFQVLFGVLWMPPIILAEACSESGAFDCPRIRRLAETLTERRLCIGWLLLNTVTPTLLYLVPPLAKTVVALHGLLLLLVPSVVVGVALLDDAGWKLRDGRGYERPFVSCHALPMRFR